ncbi:hypothetical protein [Bradyrhizobium sp. CW4]|uniref:hypothetical protein n=1 Tax=Bradyrhizobium sp. CW4 TaxID=2782687 RepID=UPI001FFA08D1|nr:hypothetical protein [Bradyrhizobium sp. CW4]
MYVVLMPRQRTNPALDEYELTVDEIVAACDGDLHDALRALMLLNELLEHRLMRLSDQMSDELEKRPPHGLLH